jgi:hypothetical protein
MDVEVEAVSCIIVMYITGLVGLGVLAWGDDGRIESYIGSFEAFKNIKRSFIFDVKAFPVS